MPLTTIVILFAALLVFVVFAAAAILLLKLLIDSYIIAIGCSIFIPIGAFRFTTHVLGHYISAVLGVGIQLFFTLVILSIATSLAQVWIKNLTTNAAFITGDIHFSLEIVADSFIFIVLLWNIPSYIARLVVGSVVPAMGSMGAGSLLRSMASGGGESGAGGSSGGGAGGGGGVGSSHSKEVFSRNLQSMLTSTAP